MSVEYCHFFRLTVCYIADHWQCFHSFHTLQYPNISADHIPIQTYASSPVSETTLERLQLEFDQLFFRATLCLLCARR